MVDRIDIESAMRLWGPIRNRIDLESLEFWKQCYSNSETDTELCSSEEPPKSARKKPAKSSTHCKAHQPR